MLHVNNLARRIERHRPLIDGAIRRVLDSGWFVLGPEVTGFESKFAAYIGCGQGISVANGTDALRIALLAGGIGPGDGVATAANAGMYSTIAILGAGAEPIFMDVDAQTHCVGIAQVEHAVALLVPVADLARFTLRHRSYPSRSRTEWHRPSA
jgi:dTDP-4-amino-4,6-dideoxygalactose transaminase